VQATYAEFLTHGDLDRHLRRTRRVYRQRRDALISALERWFPEAVPCGAWAGMHVLVTLPAGVDERVLTELALEAGVRVYPLHTYRTSRRSDHAPGLVLGYGQLTPAQSEQGARVLGELADQARS
jgi:GntR family transcriptional regulator/MocR family aminotransferase